MLFKSQKTRQKFNPDYWRDHSANERTYLSWMRASIALMGFGLVILRLRTVSSSSLGLGWLLGFVFAMVGLLTVVIATRRYFLIRRAIDSNSYEPAQVWMICFSIAIACLGSGILYFVATSPDSGGVESIGFD
jgi:putative membrane protein